MHNHVDVHCGLDIHVHVYVYVPSRRVKITVIIKTEQWHSCIVTEPISPLLTSRLNGVCGVGSMVHGGGGVGLIGEGDFWGGGLVVVTFLSLLLHISHYLVQTGQLLLLVS